MASLKDYVLDIIFPRRCLGCGILLSKGAVSYVCPSCLKTITFQNNFACAFCKSPVKNGKTCPYCAKNHFLDRLLVTTSYDNPLTEKMLKTMKYRFVRPLAYDIAGFMTKYLKKQMAKLELITTETRKGQEDRNLDQGISSNEITIAVIPVPLNRKRLNWRGFNQAEIIAQEIGNFFGWPVMADTLRRHYNRKPQADMPDRASRIENAHLLYESSSIYQSSTPIDYPQRGETAIVGKPPTTLGLSKVVGGKTILLIDDISTTGSTLDDCARALKGAGAKEVIGFVFARGTTEAQKNRRTQKEKRG